jgi:hypothetical protein
MTNKCNGTVIRAYFYNIEPLKDASCMWFFAIIVLAKFFFYSNLFSVICHKTLWNTIYVGCNSNACWMVCEIVVLVLQTSAMPSIHIILGLPQALYPDDLLCSDYETIWLIYIHTRCPSHFICCWIAKLLSKVFFFDRLLVADYVSALPAQLLSN